MTEDRVDPNVRDTHFPILIDQPWDDALPPLRRYGCKMATGSGKTVVMAMLIAWTFCNRGRVSGDTRFANAVLVACPNLTVKERLQVLRPEHIGNYYDAFDIVPSVLRPLLNQGKVLVQNWHQFAPESPHTEGDSTYRVVDKGEESPAAFVKRVLGDLAERAPILVLNDEAHHAYRPARPDRAELDNPTNDDLEFGQESSEDRDEATVWVGGLDKINQAVGIKFCVDLSATPFYLAGSGFIQGSPFPWLVSDFGLIDAIESGITKIPRLPISDTTGRPDPKFFRLWEGIRAVASRSDMIRGKPKPEFVLQQAQAALTTLASQWKERLELHQNATSSEAFVPPALIVVCDNTDIAQLFFEHIAGETTVEIEEGGKTKKRQSYGKSRLFEELQNSPEQTYTLRIDTKLLAEAEVGKGQTKSQAAEQLREIVATVGQRGASGEKIRCVVSVQMLTEGWDANNVTQILGLRAFGSQLLCEQVVGRGLRRMNYDYDSETEKLAPEYVDVFGIPFSVIPYKGRKTTASAPEDKPKNHVKALPERKHMLIRFPIVEGYTLDLQKNAITADIGSIEPINIEPIRNPTEVFVQPQVGIKHGRIASQSFETERLDRQKYYDENHLHTIKFEIARLVVMRLTETSHGGKPKLQMHSRHQLFPQVYKLVDEFIDKRVNWNGIDKRELGLLFYMQQAVERLTDAIRPDEAEGEPPLLPILNRFHPYGSSS
ncbi:MAG: DEAD/DEAH box helicase family protein [Gammaproteobacteria bacterium]